ncbi:MAG TPA: hypothetical protein VFH88_07645 [Candidatus Krumholzibacteria bacterium]|nr:hypothetical protein [Candidatus Krumholzibacteria bacterium]
MVDTTAPSDFPVEKINAAHRQALMIVGAIAGTLPMYAIVVEVLRHSQPAPVASAGLNMIRITIFVLAGIIIFTTTVIKGIMLRSTPASGEARLARLRASSVMTAALAEAPAVLGLVLFMMNRQRADFYLLLVVAAYMLARHFPQRDRWETYVRRGGDAR